MYQNDLSLLDPPSCRFRVPRQAGTANRHFWAGGRGVSNPIDELRENNGQDLVDSTTIRDSTAVCQRQDGVHYTVYCTVRV